MIQHTPVQQRTQFEGGRELSLEAWVVGTRLPAGSHGTSGVVAASGNEDFLSSLPPTSPISGNSKAGAVTADSPLASLVAVTGVLVRALSLCCSSIICCRYFPCASMRSCKFRWTCKTWRVWWWSSSELALSSKRQSIQAYKIEHFLNAQSTPSSCPIESLFCPIHSLFMPNPLPLPPSFR
jgi:hypothetical protein